MKRINKITDIINKCKNVIDIGSDHAYLSIKLLKDKRCEFVVNVEVNKGPHDQGVKNLIKHSLLKKTKNIINNGLDGLEKQLDITFDYAIVAGLGSNVIIDIVSKNKLDIKNFILQTNKNPYLLRKWLYSNKYKIISEYYILENKIYYPIFLVSKAKFNKYQSYEKLLLGDVKKINDFDIYIDSLKDQSKYIKSIVNKNIKTKMNKELLCIDKRISKYESK
ncbi:MAG: class I SAM-dependent methyltransferase [Mycoplasma sp.]